MTDRPTLPEEMDAEQARKDEEYAQQRLDAPITRRQMLAHFDNLSDHYKMQIDAAEPGEDTSTLQTKWVLCQDIMSELK